ncbi:universal stress protein [Pseudodesulfovibrio sp. JC047]|uniref:universal stress protein n=1 Tax=Pseudodesulfovibrio sp. JC047 TaxID=2683199 RepID=UPI0013D22947|nr:universal stress protein [Pseudodesulfovibrio sp. JC047]NDV20909.1 universal stress protein [Pseudodesulfovibrio sp. JC047]
MTQDSDRIHILICIGGGPEALASLNYATRLSHMGCADIDLLYVRPVDSGLQSGGMEVRVARENMLDWGLELPGMTHLKAARDRLAELGEIDPDSTRDWKHREVSGDPVGEYVREYTNPCGGSIALRLRTAPDVTTAAIDEANRVKADLIIVGASPEPAKGLKKLLSRKPLALKIAALSALPVIVARQLDPGHGHLVCVQDTDRSRTMIPEAIRYAHACQCPVSILSVAPDQTEIASAQKAVDDAAALFEADGITPHETLIEVGDPVETIITIGYDFSLVLLAESEKPWFAKGFSVAHDVAAKARNSVMILK